MTHTHSPPACATFPYKHLPDGTPVYMDIYSPGFATTPDDDAGLAPSAPPTSNAGAHPVPLVPAVIYFHGGGLTVGNRRSWLPAWLQRRVLHAGCAFISADYQLLPPATGHDIVGDIKDLLAFLVSPEFAVRLQHAPRPAAVAPGLDTAASSHNAFAVDPGAIAVAGSSAGGLCAYLAAVHCVSPKPRAVLSMYGMGGDFFTPHYLTPKTGVFFRGREILDPADFAAYLHLDGRPPELDPITDSPLAYHPATSPTPGYPANPRMLLARLYLQLGTFLDYYTGEHAQSISSRLRGALPAPQLHNSSPPSSPPPPPSPSTPSVHSLIPRSHLALFPQLNVAPSWPPTLLLHGAEDTAVPVGESRALHGLLRAAGVEAELVVLEGEEHSFDYREGAEETWGAEFDAVGEFLGRSLGRDGAQRG